ncbi:MAG: hypothetical protein AAFY73_13085 [Pseudomonadota bacterium]
MKFIPTLGRIVALALTAAGFAFVFAPDWALANLDHTREGLPAVFGGRYLGLAIAFAMFAYWRDLRGLAVMSVAGSFMAAVDVATYAAAGEPASLIAPHFAVLVLGALVARFIFRSSSFKGHAQ